MAWGTKGGIGLIFQKIIQRPNVLCIDAIIWKHNLHFKVWWTRSIEHHNGTLWNRLSHFHKTHLQYGSKKNGNSSEYKNQDTGQPLLSVENKERNLKKFNLII